MFGRGLLLPAAILLLLIPNAALSAAGRGRYLSTHDCDVCEAVMLQLEEALARYEQRPKALKDEGSLIEALETFCAAENPVWAAYGLATIHGVQTFTGPGLDGYDENDAASRAIVQTSPTWQSILAGRCSEVVGEVGETKLLKLYREHWRLAVVACNVDVESSYCARDWLLADPRHLSHRPPTAKNKERLEQLRDQWRRRGPSPKQAAANKRAKEQQSSGVEQAVREAAAEADKRDAQAAKDSQFVKQLPKDMVEALKKRLSKGHRLEDL